MKTILSISIFLSVTISIFAQENKTRVTLDSIVKEGNLLYKYEKAAWHGSDIALSKEAIKNDFGSYVIYHSNDTVYAAFTNKNKDKQIALYGFSGSNLKVPVLKDEKVKPLSKSLQGLIKAKNKILQQINTNAAEYELFFQKGFNPNAILIPTETGFKLYIIIGTPKENVIPFGNDYLFFADKNANITNWKKFHKTLIANQTTVPGGGKILSVMHSHLKMTPHISATDICTFKLYGRDLYGLKEFMVSSTALDKIFKYSAETNTIKEIALD